MQSLPLVQTLRVRLNTFRAASEHRDDRHEGGANLFTNAAPAGAVRELTMSRRRCERTSGSRQGASAAQQVREEEKALLCSFRRLSGAPPAFWCLVESKIASHSQG